MLHREERYTSDMTDQQWEIIGPLLVREREGPGRPPELDLRQVVNAIFYLDRTGCQWKNLPKDHPNHNSVYFYYGKWRDDGTWRRVLERERQGRSAEPSAIIIDSQSVKTTTLDKIKNLHVGIPVGGVSGAGLAGPPINVANRDRRPRPHAGLFVREGPELHMAVSRLAAWVSLTWGSSVSLRHCPALPENGPHAPTRRLSPVSRNVNPSPPVALLICQTKRLRRNCQLRLNLCMAGYGRHFRSAPTKATLVVVPNRRPR